MTQKTVLVDGATGKTGRRVAARLTGRGVDVRHGARNASPPFDWTNRATWLAAASGVKHLVLLSGRGEPAARIQRRRGPGGQRFLTGPPRMARKESCAPSLDRHSEPGRYRSPITDSTRDEP